MANNCLAHHNTQITPPQHSRNLPRPKLPSCPAVLIEDCESLTKSTPLFRLSPAQNSGRLCGPPAIDPEFRTIDFLTMVDLRHIPDRVRSRFF